MSSLDLKHHRDEHLNASIVTPSGNIDIFTYQAFGQYLKDLFATGQVKRVIIDLVATAYIASSGWAVLLSQSRMLQRTGGKMVLANMKEEVREVYEVMNIEPLLPRAADASKVVSMLDQKA